MDAETKSSTLAVLHEKIDNNEIMNKELWVFAYGSLCWKPGFNFQKAVVGYVQGYSRKFWQGNTTHRGTQEKPGRVATLVEENKGRVHGIAYAIGGNDAIPYLSKRECELGGYISHMMNFQPKQGESFNVLVYIATPKNPFWLGEARETEIANQIVDCSGPSGHNVEYVLRLANFMRDHFPSETDHHLYSLEEEVMRKIKCKNLSLASLMGDGRGCVSFVRSDDVTRDGEQYQYTARISSPRSSIDLQNCM